MTHSTPRRTYQLATSLVAWLIKEALWFPPDGWSRSLKLATFYGPLFGLAAVVALGGWSNMLGSAVGGIIFGLAAGQMESKGWHLMVRGTLLVGTIALLLMRVLQADGAYKLSFGLIFAAVGGLMGWHEYQQSLPSAHLDLRNDTRATDDLDGFGLKAPPSAW